MTIESEVVCKKCASTTSVVVHWTNAYHFVTCSICKKESMYEFKNWEIVNKYKIVDPDKNLIEHFKLANKLIIKNISEKANKTK